MQQDATDKIRDRERVEAVALARALARQSSAVLTRLTRLAARLLRSPVALVNLVEADRQISVARVAPDDWPASPDTPLSDSFCKYAITTRQPVAIDDARHDDRVSGSRVVTELGVESYLGVPLTSREGHVLGTLCVVDFQPRSWSEEERDILLELTSAVMTALELRRSMHEVEEAERLAGAAERERREKTALLESTSEGIYGVDLEGRCTFINRAGTRILGYSAEECLGKNMHQLIHHSRADGSPYPEFECPIFEAIQGCTEARLDDEVLWRKDGSSFPAEYASAPIQDAGEVRGAVVTFSDATDRRRSEAADRLFNHMGKVLSASSLDYAATLRSLVRLSIPALGDWCSLLAVHEDGRVERLELAHADPDGEALAQKLRRYPIGPADVHPAYQALRSGEARLLEQIPDELLGQVAADEEHLRILRELGMESAMIVPLIARGRSLGVLTLIRTTPGRRYTGQDLELAKEFASRAALAVDNARLYRESQEANHAKAEFLATVSHELRTPLNAIIGYTSLMRDGVPVEVPHAALAYLDRIDVSSRHLRQLIEEILSFSRLESGQETTSLQTIDVADLVDELREVMQPLAEDRDLEFRVALPEEIAPFRTDPTKLRQLLLNLLDNAVKFTREGTVELAVREDDAMVCFSVRDTGPGIRREDWAKIFEPFRQLEQSNVREVGGTGLGLTVVRHLVNLLGGRMELESEPGQGSTFHVHLPRPGAAALSGSQPEVEAKR